MEILKTFPIKASYAKDSRSGSRLLGMSRTVWVQWFDGKIRFARQGVDFSCSRNAFLRHLRLECWSRKLKVRAMRLVDGVVFQVSKE